MAKRDNFDGGPVMSSPAGRVVSSLARQRIIVPVCLLFFMLLQYYSRMA
jgi:hypothetical protein